MSDVITLANKIAAEKENIRQAIITRGVDVPVTTPLSDYPGKIASIDTENVATDVYMKDENFDKTAATYTMPGNYGTIADGAFEGYDKLETVDLSYVATIEPEAFAQCSALSSVTGSHLKYVGADAFKNSSLASFENPTVKFIGNNAFNSSKIATVSASECEVIQGGAFYKCGSLETVDLPKVKEIPGRCFSDCSILKSVNAPVAEYVGGYGFYQAGNGAYTTYGNTYTISLPEVKTVGDYAFYDCNGLTSIDLSEVLSLGNYALWGTNNLATVNAPKLKTIGNYTFDDYNNISSLYIPKCNLIGDYNFCNNSHILDTLTIEDGCTIGNYNFIYGVTKVIGKPSKIGNYVMKSINSTITLDIDFSEVTSIGQSCFRSDSDIHINFADSMIDLANCTYFSSPDGSAYRSFYVYGTGATNRSNVKKIWIRGDATFSNTAGATYWFNICNNSTVNIYTDAESKPSNWGTLLSNATWHFGATHEEFEEA